MTQILLDLILSAQEALHLLESLKADDALIKRLGDSILKAHYEFIKLTADEGRHLIGENDAKT